VILAWVISLLLLCSTLLIHLERLSALRIIEVNTIESAQSKFIAAEKSIAQCEAHISNLSALTRNDCYIQSVGKNMWRITSKENPIIEIHIDVDEKTGTVRRMNWRQIFE
jgi:hypothetical protein